MRPRLRTRRRKPRRSRRVPRRSWRTKRITRRSRKRTRRTGRKGGAQHMAARRQSGGSLRISAEFSKKTSAMRNKASETLLGGLNLHYAIILAFLDRYNLFELILELIPNPSVGHYDIKFLQLFMMNSPTANNVWTKKERDEMATSFKKEWGEWVHKIITDKACVDGVTPADRAPIAVLNRQRAITYYEGLINGEPFPGIVSPIKHYLITNRNLSDIAREQYDIFSTAIRRIIDDGLDKDGLDELTDESTLKIKSDNLRNLIDEIEFPDVERILLKEAIQQTIKASAIHDTEPSGKAQVEAGRRPPVSLPKRPSEEWKKREVLSKGGSSGLVEHYVLELEAAKKAVTAASWTQIPSAKLIPAGVELFTALNRRVEKVEADLSVAKEVILEKRKKERSRKKAQKMARKRAAAAALTPEQIAAAAGERFQRSQHRTAIVQDREWTEPDALVPPSQRSSIPTAGAVESDITRGE